MICSAVVIRDIPGLHNSEPNIRAHNVKNVRMASIIEKEELNVKVRLSASELQIISIQSMREPTPEQGRLVETINQNL